MLLVYIVSNFDRKNNTNCIERKKSVTCLAFVEHFTSLVLLLNNNCNIFRIKKFALTIYFVADI